MKRRRPDFTLQDIIDSQPGLPAKPARWVVDNWLSIATLTFLICSQIWNGTSWLHARENTEAATKADVDRLAAEVKQLPDTYVSKDTFTQVLIDIRGQLANINNQLAQQRR